MKLFEVKNLRARIEGKEVLKGIDLTLESGKVYAIMGRNGSGKTSLAHTLMGHPKYEVIDGDILLNGESLKGMSADERARKGMFLAFQYPVGIPGVTVANFLRTSFRAIHGDALSAKEVRIRIKEEAQALEIPDSFMTRSLGDGFSGGERKRLETLQLRLLQPKVAILDETDSGLDIDALRKVSERIDSLRGPDRAILLITHYQRMLDVIAPDVVHVLLDGRIQKTGGPGLALELEAKGYDWLTSEKGVQ